MRLPSLAVGLAALALGASCSPERELSLVARLGEAPEAGFFAPETVFREVEVVTVPLRAPAAPGPETPNPPLADAEVRIVAEEIQVVEATMLDMPRGELHLVWALDGVDDGIDRRLVLPGMQVPGDGRKVFRFDVASEPEWRGSISRLQLYTGARHRATARVESLRGLGWRSPDEEAGGAAGRPRWVDLGNDVRPAVLLDETIRYRVERTIGGGERLRAEIGVGRGAMSALEFVLEVVEDGRVVRSQVLRAVDSDEAERWIEVEVDLGDLTGRLVELGFGAREVRPSGRRPPFAFLANLRIVGPAKRLRRPNVIVVSIDTLRADALSLHGAGRPTSPNLDARATRNGFVFDDAIAPAPSTLPSHASLFTGVDAFRHHAVFRAAPSGLETLAERLRSRGYRTFARTGGGYLHPRWGLVQGFDRYAYWLNTHDRDGELKAGVDDAIRFLDGAHEAPFLLFLHTYEVHSPYRARQPFFGELWPGSEAPRELIWIEAEEPTAATGYRVPRRAEYRFGGPDPNVRTEGEPADAQLARRAYESSVAYVDAQLERLWRALDRLDLWRDAVVVVTSDHGEAFGEHELAGHGYLYEHNLRVPLIVFAPGIDGPRRIGQQVRLVDVVPTLLELVEIPAPEGLDGRSLVRSLREGRDPELPREAWSYAGNSMEGAALRVAGRAKLILDNSSVSAAGPRVQLFDLVADPDELLDLGRTEPLTDRMAAELIDRLRREHAGLAIEVRNRGASPATVRIEGDGVDPRSTKVDGLALSGLTWSAKRPVLRCAPGSRQELLLEGELGSRLDLIARGGGAAESDRLEVPLDEVPRSLVWRADSGWSASDGVTKPGDLVVEMRWNGGATAEGPTGARPDTELLLQLQALGYVH